MGIFGKLNFDIEASSSIKMAIFKLSLYFLFVYFATAEKFCKTEGINPCSPQGECGNEDGAVCLTVIDDQPKKTCCLPGDQATIEDHTITKGRVTSDESSEQTEEVTTGPEDTTSVGPDQPTSIEPEDTSSVGPEDTMFCKDKKNPKTGRSDCPKLVKYCNHPRYYDLMTNQCAKTCKRCGGKGKNGSCVDGVNPRTGKSDCLKLKRLCQHPQYYTLMKSECPKSCGYCK
ncbi:hypothetical protein WR25_11311 [Diploscapter pachys]|uniref:ShKT domain-containing protein n=1 Tax=Diploscapter pachys TaxID=2018661 RepID=A0A2A2JIR3_9BILA|nr:hypothetical protein WR25_11311 [Diploscapter pachys]